MSAIPMVLTVNQVVAANLRRARESKGWTQSEAALALMPHLGLEKPWTTQTFSAAERSFESVERQRDFSAADLIAFCRTFDKPISYFFEPPEGVLEVSTGAPGWTFEVEIEGEPVPYTWWGYNPRNAHPGAPILEGPVGPHWLDTINSRALLEIIRESESAQVASKLRALADELEAKR